MSLEVSGFVILWPLYIFFCTSLRDLVSDCLLVPRSLFRHLYLTKPHNSRSKDFDCVSRVTAKKPSVTCASPINWEIGTQHCSCVRLWLRTGLFGITTLYHLYKIMLFQHELALTHVDATHSVVHNDIIHTVGQHVDSCYKTVGAQTACGAQCACPPIARAESLWHTGGSLASDGAAAQPHSFRCSLACSWGPGRPVSLPGCGQSRKSVVFWSNLAKTTLSAMSIVGRAIYPPPPAHTDISTHSARS